MPEIARRSLFAENLRAQPNFGAKLRYLRKQYAFYVASERPELPPYTGTIHSKDVVKDLKGEVIKMHDPSLSDAEIIAIQKELYRQEGSLIENMSLPTYSEYEANTNLPSRDFDTFLRGIKRVFNLREGEATWEALLDGLIDTHLEKKSDILVDSYRRMRQAGRPQ